MSCRRRAGVIFATLAGACGGDAAATDAGACATEVVVVDGALTRDVDAECVVLRAGSTIQIRGDVTTVIRARSLVVEGALTVEGRGADAVRAAEWRSSGPCLNAHYDWFDQSRTPTEENVGRPGDTGGTLELRYGRVVGGRARLGLIRFSVEGGAGAPGRVLRCGCAELTHADHVANFPSGPRGASGTWRFLEEDE